MTVAVFAERRLCRHFLCNNTALLQLKKGSLCSFPGRLGQAPCTGRCLCLLQTFLLHGSFCNNNNKEINTEENPSTFKPAPSKNREGCRRAEAMKPQEACGLLRPLPAPGVLKLPCPGVILGMGLLTAETEIGVLQEATWFLITQSHLYILFGYWFDIFIPYVVHLVQKKKWINQVNVLY